MRTAWACLCLVMVLFPALARGEDPATLIQSATEFLNQGKYSKAIEDLQWALREIRLLQTVELKKFLPQSVSGYTAEEVDADAAAAAMFNINLVEAERKFQASSGDEYVDLKITSGDIGGAGLGAMMKMSQMFGEQQGELVRVKGRKCTLEWDADNSSGKLTCVLDNDIQVTVEVSNGQKATPAKFMELVNLDGLEKATL
ncbi:MAG: hypothetical protein MUE60_09760 [Candidatus Eisenbacteria bacterium]|nr:hypothetical protein [Candidatus Eisenbacteria bacterium]